MGVIITTDTTDIPITMIGIYAGECYGADTRDHVKNYKRGLECIKNNHGRTLEFPQVYVKVTGYSARVIREFARHVGGLPSYLQASTRYIEYGDFNYIIPPSIKDEAKNIYVDTMKNIGESIQKLEEMGVPREDSAMLLPLGMETSIVWRGNLRVLIDMSRTRMCSRAYWEFRKLFKEIIDALAFYSDEWNYLVNTLKVFKPRCEELGYCPEVHSCGRMKVNKDQRDAAIKKLKEDL